MGRVPLDKPKRTWAGNDGRPGFPATGRHQRPRVRLSFKESRMEFANANKVQEIRGKPFDRFY
jgi:hypothetical protein